jgi:hypothetical protein
MAFSGLETKISSSTWKLKQYHQAKTNLLLSLYRTFVVCMYWSAHEIHSPYFVLSAITLCTIARASMPQMLEPDIVVIRLDFLTAFSTYPEF